MKPDQGYTLINPIYKDPTTLRITSTYPLFIQVSSSLAAMCKRAVFHLITEPQQPLGQITVKRGRRECFCN
jgi:hypothetical protein